MSLPGTGCILYWGFRKQGSSDRGTESSLEFQLKFGSPIGIPTESVLAVGDIVAMVSRWNKLLHDQEGDQSSNPSIYQSGIHPPQPREACCRKGVDFIVEALDNMSVLILRELNHRVVEYVEWNIYFIDFPIHLNRPHSKNYKNPEIRHADYQQSTSILASVVIKEDSSQAPETTGVWEYWWSIKTMQGWQSDNKVWSFSPSQGSNTRGYHIRFRGPKTWYYDVFSNYTPQYNNSNAHKLVFEAKPATHWSQTEVFISVTGPVPVSNTIDTAPSLDEFLHKGSSGIMCWSQSLCLESSDEDTNLSSITAMPSFECLNSLLQFQMTEIGTMLVKH